MINLILLEELLQITELNVDDLSVLVGDVLLSLNETLILTIAIRYLCLPWMGSSGREGSVYPVMNSVHLTDHMLAEGCSYFSQLHSRACICP